MEKIDIKKYVLNTYNLINKYFKDKVDKGGQPYIGHLYRVANSIENEKNDNVTNINSTLSLYYDKAIIVAYLHDILEDTDCTEDELYEAGCDEEIVEAIKSVTRRKDEQYYFDFIERTSKNDIGRLVKIYDLEDNMDIKRLNTFDDYDQKRLKKYWYSWRYLKGKISAVEANNIIHSDRKFK